MRQRKWDRVGMLAETTREIRNGYGAIPKGTLVLVTTSGPGYGVETLPCAECGTRWSCSRVDGRAFVDLARITSRPLRESWRPSKTEIEAARTLGALARARS